MNDDQKKLVYSLYKKGRKNFSQFDKIIIESNPFIKEELKKFELIDDTLYNECNEIIDEQISIKSKPEKNIISSFPFKVISVAAAACFMLIMGIFIFHQYNKKRISLGGRVSLYITSPEKTDLFYDNGSSFMPGKKIKLSFQMPSGADKIKQGIIFSVDNNGENNIYYRFNDKNDSIIQSKRIDIGEITLPEKDTVYFIAFFSNEAFVEKDIIKSVSKIIKKENNQTEKILLKEFKNNYIDVIYMVSFKL